MNEFPPVFETKAISAGLLKMRAYLNHLIAVNPWGKGVWVFLCVIYRSTGLVGKF